jgi:hypothetical protein
LTKHDGVEYWLEVAIDRGNPECLVGWSPKMYQPKQTCDCAMPGEVERWCAVCRLRVALETAERSRERWEAAHDHVDHLRKVAEAQRDEARAALETAERDAEARIVADLRRIADDTESDWRPAERRRFRNLADRYERGDHRKGGK